VRRQVRHALDDQLREADVIAGLQQEPAVFKTIAIALAVMLAVAIGAVLAYAATKPDVFRVQRAATIKAPAAAIFPMISDFRNWAAWSPYEKKDPAMKKTYSGAPSGQGAIYEWDGDKNVGRGRIEITDASVPSRVALNLDMLAPFKAHNVVEFTLEPKGEFTTVTWAMNGRVPFFAKVLHVFFDMDRMVGQDFEAGLAGLKAIAERRQP
jgi:uncharacterized protein YndB with AHSA1/START domain